MSDLIDRKQAILAVCSVCSAVRPEYRGEKCMYFADGCEEIERLRELPSVDAVPVVLIKELLTRLRRRRMNLDDDCVDEAWNLTMQMEALNDLLSEWAERKTENG